MHSHRPNFLFIGPDKAGSTWLYQALRQHHQACLPKAKELFFFDKFFDRGWRWYESFFKDANENCHILAEISHDYLFSTLACERIARHLPSSKLMVCLREPSQRAFSAYLYMLKQGRVKSTFEEALKEVDELIDHGRYAKYLVPYISKFGRERIHVAIFDDLVENPQQFFNNVCDFLEIDRIQLSEQTSGNVLPAARPRFPFVAKVARSVGWQVRRMGMPGLVGRLKESTLLNRVLYERYSTGNRPAMSANVKNHLRHVFSPEIQRIDALLKTDLGSRWGYSATDETIEPCDSFSQEKGTPR